MSSPRRVASVIRVAAGNIQQYELLHRAVWPGVLRRLQESGVRDYSIYRYDELLFSYFEYVGDDYEADMAAIAADPETQRWWKVCGPLQQPVPERRPDEWWHEIQELFHLD